MPGSCLCTRKIRRDLRLPMQRGNFCLWKEKRGDSVKIELPGKVREIIGRLQSHGFEAYAVGGCVRDSLLGREPGDWDITTSARPEQVKALFARTVDTGIQHGTVTVLLGQEGFEVTTYRVDGEYQDARHPKNVYFTDRLAEDLKRRDFTVNAMAYNDESGLVDLFDGAGDLERGVIRCVGAPEERFGEDALRMLRAVRFAAQLGFSIEENTENAVRDLAGNLSRISAERIQAELVKLIISPHPEEMREACRLGLTDVFLPEFSVMMETEQHSRHHCYTVGEHTIHAMQLIRADRVLRLTMLFHDVAKPACLTTDSRGLDHFRGHPAKGAEMARGILRRLKFDNATTDRVVRFVRFHDIRPEPVPEKIRRAAVQIGPDAYPEIFEIMRADIGAQSLYQREEKLAYVDEYEAVWRRIVEDGDCLSLKDLAVKGTDLIAWGMKPGRELGDVLQKMLSEVLSHPERNRKEILEEHFRRGDYSGRKQGDAQARDC